MVKIIALATLLFIAIPFFSFASINGFLGLDAGFKLEKSDTVNDKNNLIEQRLQLKTSIYPEILESSMPEINIKLELLFDEYSDFETELDLRTLNFAFSPMSNMDVKIGRQIFTWGTGDYLFVNDLFPKDYVSFYIGRDDEYLKKPNDGLRFLLYSNYINFDIVYIPLFEYSDSFTGNRLSFYDPFIADITGANSNIKLKEPSENLKNSEYALRLYKTIKDSELAMYFFKGFYKLPLGIESLNNQTLYYPRLNSYGFSFRIPFLSGIANTEFAYYDSIEDNDGTDPFVENSKYVFLLAFEKDLGSDLSCSLQWQTEMMSAYENYIDSYLGTAPKKEYWHLSTLRIVKLLYEQNVRLNIFTFLVPEEKGLYIKPSIDYTASDNIKLSLGANLIWGKKENSYFGQSSENKNVYTRFRYNF